jgi:hypothetical protein
VGSMVVRCWAPMVCAEPIGSSTHLIYITHVSLTGFYPKV